MPRRRFNEHIKTISHKQALAQIKQLPKKVNLHRQLQVVPANNATGSAAESNHFADVSDIEHDYEYENDGGFEEGHDGQHSSWPQDNSDSAKQGRLSPEADLDEDLFAPSNSNPIIDWAEVEIPLHVSSDDSFDLESLFGSDYDSDAEGTFDQ